MNDRQADLALLRQSIGEAIDEVQRRRDWPAKERAWANARLDALLAKEEQLLGEIERESAERRNEATIAEYRRQQERAVAEFHGKEWAS